MARRSTREQRVLLDWFSWENCLRQDKLFKVQKLPLVTGTRCSPSGPCSSPRNPTRSSAREPLGPRSSERIRIGQRKVQQEFEVSSERCCSWALGMTVEHLQPLLDNPSALHSMFLLGEKLARADVPPSIVDTIRQGRLTALRKPNGGVRGIVVGDAIRRVVARTVAQQLGPAVEGATAPFFQYALSTKAGCECVSHVVQAFTEADPEEETDFGQSRFGHPDLTNSGQSQFWPIQFWPIYFWIWCVSWWGPKGCGVKPRKMWDPEVMEGPEGWSPEGWGAQNFALFSLFRSLFRSFCLSLCIFSWFFGGVF